MKYNTPPHFFLGELISLMTASVSLLAAANPVPFVNNPLVPTSISPGAGAFTLILNGANFVPGATVYWNGSPRVTTFISSRQVEASILASDLNTAATAEVAVGNPGTVALSNSSYFAVSRSSSALTKPALFAVATQSASYFSNFAAPCDLNGDGKVDIAGTDGLNVNVLLGNGDGTFQLPIAYSIGSVNYTIYAIAVGDLNNDGKPDLVVGGTVFEINGLSTLITVLLGNGDGTFQVLPSVNVGAAPTLASVALGDFNSDGNLDVATANGENGTNNVVILSGNGDGTFQPYTETPLDAADPLALATGDYNRDGILDLAVLVYQGYEILTGVGNGSFFGGPISTGFNSFEGIAAGDIDADGITDLVIVSASAGTSYLHGNGDGTFQPEEFVKDGNRSPYGVALGDFNADNRVDVVAGDSTGGGEILMNPSTGLGLPLAVTSRGAPLSTHAAVADFNGDGKLDFVLANTGVFLSTDVSLSPTSLTFSGSVGVPTALQTVTLSNSGATSIYVGGISFSDEYPINFSQTNNCGTKLLAGASCMIDVTFVATNDLTFQSATMTVSEAAGRSQSISLAGSASGSNPVVQLSSSSLNFGSQRVGQPSSPTTVKLANVGNANLRSLSVAIAGTNASDFALSSNTCQATVKENGTCAVSIVFTPSATGPRSAMLSFADNAYNTPQTVALTGTGQ